MPDLSDPIVGWLRPGDTLDAAKMEQFVTLAREHEPQLFEEAMRAVERRA